MSISMALARRLAGLTFALIAVVPAPAAAAPLIVTFEGFIPELTVFTTERIGTDSPTVIVTVLSDVAFTGTMTFERGRLANATSGTWAGIDGHVYREEDPAGGTGAGVESTEWMRATMTLATPTPTTLAFNRDITTATADATAFGLPYEGNQTVFYREGSVFTPPQGDVFAFELRNRLSFASINGDPVADYGRTYDSWIYMAIATGIAFPPYGSFELIDLFGPGAPPAFLWEDGDTTQLADGRRTLESRSQFSHFVGHTAYDPQLGQRRTSMARYDGDLILTRVQLLAVDVPEPGTGVLTVVGGLAGLVARHRRTRRRTPADERPAA